MNKKLERVALTNLDIPTLELRGSDRLDFHDCGVANIKQALNEAYNLGKCDNSKLLNEIIEAIKNFHKAKDRYQTQIACAKLFELVGLPTQYPDSYKE